MPSQLRKISRPGCKRPVRGKVLISSYELEDLAVIEIVLKQVVELEVEMTETCGVSELHLRGSI